MTHAITRNTQPAAQVTPLEIEAALVDAPATVRLAVNLIGHCRFRPIHIAQATREDLRLCAEHAPPAAAEEIRQYLAERPTGPLFPMPWRGKPMTANRVAHLVRTHFRERGVSLGVREIHHAYAVECGR